MPATVWKRPWNVGCEAAGSGENALRYLSRYVFKTATGNRTVQLLPDDSVRWPYRESQTGKHTSIRLPPLEWMRRLLQHILPRSFARVRTFGWLHPAARLRLNRVRALLGQSPVLTAAESQTWNPPPNPDEQLLDDPTHSSELAPPNTHLSTPAAQPILCPHCRKVMRLIGTWRPNQPLLYPKRPP